MADLFGESFAERSSSRSYTNVFRDIRERTALLDFSPPRGSDFAYNHLFSLTEFRDTMASCKEGATGPDDISCTMLRHLHPSASTFLLSFFNRIWIEGSFPTLWQSAIVIPVHKPGKDSKLAENARPISLTCVPCKLMERMVAGRLLPVLESLHAFSDSQFGFRRHRSTIDPLIRLDHDIREAISDGRMVLGVFFDLEKAYDTTWRVGILNQLHRLGFRGQLPTFLKCLLTVQ